MRRAWGAVPLWEAAAVAAVTALGTLLRFNGYGRAPALTDNADELQFAWAGLNMIERGDAYTWSYFPAYGPPQVLHAYGETFPMVHHWLDHPPGFSLLLGGFLWLTGERDPLTLDAARIRFLPVLLAAAAVPLAYLLARRCAGRGPALFGALLLATSPGAVLLGRQAEPESVMAPLFLAGLLLASSRPTRAGDAALFAICLACPFFKVTGLAVGAVCFLVLLARGRRPAAIACLIAGGLGLLAYAAYGWAVDWKLFQTVIAEQAANRKGVFAGFEFIAEPAGVNRRLRDGWWLLGWVGVGAALAAARSAVQELLAWPALAYAAAIMLLASQQLTAQFGWYRVMVEPEVLLAAGGLVWLAVVAPTPARLLAVIVLGGATATDYWLAPAGGEFVPDAVLAGLALAAIVVPAGLAATPRFSALRGWARGSAAVVAGLLLLGNVSTSLRLEELFFRL